MPWQVQGRRRGGGRCAVAAGRRAALRCASPRHPHRDDAWTPEPSRATLPRRATPRHPTPRRNAKAHPGPRPARRRIVPHRVEPRRALTCHAVPCRATSCRAAPFAAAAPRRTNPSRGTPHRAEPYQTGPCCANPISAPHGTCCAAPIRSTRADLRRDAPSHGPEAERSNVAGLMSHAQPSRYLSRAAVSHRFEPCQPPAAAAIAAA